MRRFGFRSGFTLIELLVVIAIIAILAAILFPVFAKAREKARQITCISNLKELALAMNMYKEDYDEQNFWFRGRPQGLGAVGSTIASGMNPSGCYGGTNDCHTWAGSWVGTAAWQYANVPMAYKASINPYIKNDGIFYCPSDSWALNSGHHSCSYDGAPVSYIDGTGQQAGGAWVAWDPAIVSLVNAQYSGQLTLDHYYTSYRFYKRTGGDTSCNKDDQDPGSFWDIEFQKFDSTTGWHTISPVSYLLFVEDWAVHQPVPGQIYGRNTSYRDGHAKWMNSNENYVN